MKRSFQTKVKSSPICFVMHSNKSELVSRDNWLDWSFKPRLNSPHSFELKKLHTISKSYASALVQLSSAKLLIKLTSYTIEKLWFKFYLWTHQMMAVIYHPLNFTVSKICGVTFTSDENHSSLSDTILFWMIQNKKLRPDDQHPKAVIFLKQRPKTSKLGY